MFDFKDETGSEDRFGSASAKANAEGLVIQHRAWWLVHNLVAHPLIGVFPTRVTFQFHDWTSRKMAGVGP